MWILFRSSKGLYLTQKNWIYAFTKKTLSGDKLVGTVVVVCIYFFNGETVVPHSKMGLERLFNRKPGFWGQNNWN